MSFVCALGLFALAFGLLMPLTYGVSGVDVSPRDEAAVVHGVSKITFDLSDIDESGLAGPPGGQVAVAYELCVPADEERMAEVQSLDPSIRMYQGSRGRIGCGPDQTLSIGSTHQPGWRSVLIELAALEYIERIDRFYGE
jgi:hypothetical protein